MCSLTDQFYSDLFQTTQLSSNPVSLESCQIWSRYSIINTTKLALYCAHLLAYVLLYAPTRGVIAANCAVTPSYSVEGRWDPLCNGLGKGPSGLLIELLEKGETLGNVSSFLLSVSLSLLSRRRMTYIFDQKDTFRLNLHVRWYESFWYEYSVLHSFLKLKN